MDAWELATLEGCPVGAATHSVLLGPGPAPVVCMSSVAGRRIVAPRRGRALRRARRQGQGRGRRRGLPDRRGLRGLRGRARRAPVRHIAQNGCPWLSSAPLANIREAGPDRLGPRSSASMSPKLGSAPGPRHGEKVRTRLLPAARTLERIRVTAAQHPCSCCRSRRYRRGPVRRSVGGSDRRRTHGVASQSQATRPDLLAAQSGRLVSGSRGHAPDDRRPDASCPARGTAPCQADHADTHFSARAGGLSRCSAHGPPRSAAPRLDAESEAGRRRGQPGRDLGFLGLW